MKKTSSRIRLLLFLASLVLLSSCGFKGPPVPPGEKLPEAPQGLKVEKVDEGFFLTWKNTGKKPRGFRVYRAPFPEDSCTECPRLYSLQAELEPEAGSYLDRTRLDGPFYYEVRAFIAGNLEGRGTVVSTKASEAP